MSELDPLKVWTRRIAQILFLLALQAALLFVSAGRWDWIAGWLYTGLYFVLLLANAIVQIPRMDIGLIEERSRTNKAGAKDWDKRIAPLSVLAGLAALVVAGLDERLGWSHPLGLAWQALGLLGMIYGYALFTWAMSSNRFFSAVVRIQTDRGHTVQTGGPYRFVRHPGYHGLMILYPAMALMFDSLWVMIPALLAAALVVVRTKLEDDTLQAELPDYQEYAARVRYRLLPGIW